MYKNKRVALNVKEGTFPPAASEKRKRAAPPKSCEMPVIQSGETPLAIRPLIVIEITVQSDARIINISPAEKP
mgnify:CR=1 FL=1